MGKFNEYTQKATPADNDTLMIYDATSKANKLSPFSGIWNWIVEKLTNAVISNLQTNNKTVLGAINELDNNRAFGTLITSEGHDCNNLGFGIFLLLNPKNGVAEINWHVIISANSDGAQTGFQIAYDLTDGTKAYIRKQASGIWSEWRHFNTSEILSNLTTTNKSSLVDAINELNSKVFIKTQNLSTFSINIKLNKNTYTSFIMYGATSQNNGFMYIVFIDVASAKRAVNFIKIADFVAGRTFSGTYSDDTSTLTINANDTIWGGIKLLMFKEENY